MTNHIRQSEFAATHSLTATEIKIIRDEQLTAEEWHTEGRAIFWTKEAADRVKATLIGANPPEATENYEHDSQGHPESEEEAPTTLNVRVTKTARNYLFVYASLDGERISVQCRKKSRKGLVGKNINVRVEVIDGETRYFHQP